MARLFNKGKTLKEKVQLIKDLASGKQSIESLVESSRPGRHCTIYQFKPGVYTVEGVEMNQTEYDQWHQNQHFKETDMVFVFSSDPRNAPLNEDSNEVEPKTLSFVDFKDYSGKEEEPRIIEVEVIKRDPEPVNEPMVKPEVKQFLPKPKRVKKAATVTIEKAPVEQIGETITFKRPPFKRDLDMREYRGFTDSVKRLFNNF